MSRAKFEEWLNKPCSAIEDPVAWVVSDVDSIAYQAWLAGRESMRDEAAEIAANQWVKDPQVSACDRIMDIEP